MCLFVTKYLPSHWKLGILPSCHQPYLLRHVFILILDRFSMFSPFPSHFIPHQIFRRWTFVASEAQMQSAVASKRPCKYIYKHEETPIYCWWLKTSNSTVNNNIYKTHRKKLEYDDRLSPDCIESLNLPLETISDLSWLHGVCIFIWVFHKKVINPIQIINPELYDAGMRARVGLNKERDI